MQEKKHLEEELNRMRSSALISSTFMTSQHQPPAPHPVPQEPCEGGATAAGYGTPEFPGDPDRLASVAPVGEEEHDRVDPAVEASMVAMQ